MCSIEERVRARLVAGHPVPARSELWSAPIPPTAWSPTGPGAGAPEGLVVAADVQTAGRGRLDRTWEAAPGSALLVSVLLRPGSPAGPLAPGHGRGRPGRGRRLRGGGRLHAPAQVAQRPAGREAASWPASWPRRRASAVVVGMGLNVHCRPARCGLGRRGGRAGVDRSDLLGAWLAALDGWLGRLAGGGRRLPPRVPHPRAPGGGRAGRRAAGGLAEEIDDAGRLLVRGDGGDRWRSRPATSSTCGRRGGREWGRRGGAGEAAWAAAAVRGAGGAGRRRRRAVGPAGPASHPAVGPSSDFLGARPRSGRARTRYGQSDAPRWLRCVPD